jgi:hypothetical protein
VVSVFVRLVLGSVFGLPLALRPFRLRGVLQFGGSVFLSSGCGAAHSSGFCAVSLALVLVRL